MKKIFLAFMVLVSCVFASDELNIDSLFKKQIGLRSITSFSLLSTGNANSYSLYPNITIGGDPTIWNDTKQVFLTQTFIYTLTPKLDILISGGGSYARQEYTNFFTNAYSHKDRIGFDNLWLGFIYTGDSIADLIPQITFQTAVVQREKAINQTKNFYLKSQSLQASLRGYSDPVVYSIYTGFGYNQSRKFKTLKIEYGNSIYVGGDLSIILSPKITLDLGAEQRFQMKQKINGYQNSEVRSIPTLSLGSTYSINSDTAVSVNASFGGSSASPDSIFGISLWKKF
ncbi:hypothetical protein CNS46_05790 [Campylobacter coli]|uniref:hypothetical protein n=1 Tax=Campylobacter coli TaxID=195 RepID=UPI001285E020|nr:hypothetical protein [Campylobacter coli]EAI1815915.1 hypothetical protein [Campylobacter coli]EAI2565227.1 hypothetical protein [Campylobacter coli]EAI3420823.1 hypothetical protein [Campylobacter coli]EAI7493179.1 hypothetical protein [Campylobacter coli]